MHILSESVINILKENAIKIKITEITYIINSVKNNIIDNLDITSQPEDKLPTLRVTDDNKPHINPINNTMQPHAASFACGAEYLSNEVSL